MPIKLTRFQDIPAFTRAGSWECDFDLDGVWQQIQKWSRAEDGTSALDLNPDFQRAHVWTEAQQIAWMEFWMRGGKTGRVLYFNHSGWFRSWNGSFVVVDGKQRIEAIRRFLENEIPVFGSFCREYSDRPRMFVQTIKINVNDLKTRAEVLQWYIEFNAGGTPHTDAEIDRVRELLRKENPDASETPDDLTPLPLERVQQLAQVEHNTPMVYRLAIEVLYWRGLSDAAALMCAHHIPLTQPCDQCTEAS